MFNIIKLFKTEDKKPDTEDELKQLKSRYVSLATRFAVARNFVVSSPCTCNGKKPACARCQSLEHM